MCLSPCVSDLDFLEFSSCRQGAVLLRVLIPGRSALIAGLWGGDGCEATGHLTHSHTGSQRQPPGLLAPVGGGVGGVWNLILTLHSHSHTQAGKISGFPPYFLRVHCCGSECMNTLWIPKSSV